jgi:hypothetical protein
VFLERKSLNKCALNTPDATPPSDPRCFLSASRSTNARVAPYCRRYPAIFLECRSLNKCAIDTPDATPPSDPRCFLSASRSTNARVAPYCRRYPAIFLECRSLNKCAIDTPDATPPSDPRCFLSASLPMAAVSHAPFHPLLTCQHLPMTLTWDSAALLASDSGFFFDITDDVL